MYKALNATGRPILYSLCNWGVDGPWNFGPTIANSWRTNGDLTTVWDRDNANCPCTELEGLDCKSPGGYCSVMNTVNKAAYYPSKSVPGAWNDLDMLRTLIPYLLRCLIADYKSRGRKWRIYRQ